MASHPFQRYRPIIDDWDGFLAALNRPLPTCVWAHPHRIERGELRRRLEADGFSCRPVSWHPRALLLDNLDRPGHRFEYLAGLYHVQEEVSLLPPVLLAPEPGERHLDLCAAPGNKTAQLALAMDNRGTVVANDRDINRLRALRRNIDRLGAINVTITSEDAANYPAAAGRFDAVLADVPCSCEGTTRKDPDAVIRDAERDAAGQTGVQTAILTRALRLCRPDGRVVYSTCTFAPEENEGVVETAIQRAAEFDVTVTIEPVSLPDFDYDQGLTTWRGREFRPTMRRAIRVWPHCNDTGGFFAVRLRRQR